MLSMDEDIPREVGKVRAARTSRSRERRDNL